MSKKNNNKPRAYKDNPEVIMANERNGILRNLRYALPILEKKEIEDIIKELEKEKESSEAADSINKLQEVLDFYKTSKMLPQNIIFFKKLSNVVENINIENKVIDDFKAKLDLLINGNDKIQKLRTEKLSY